MIIMSPVIDEKLVDYAIESTDKTEITLFPVPENLTENDDIVDLLISNVFQITIVDAKIKVFKFKLSLFKGRFFRVITKTKKALDDFDKLSIDMKNQIYLYHHDKKLRIFEL